MRIGIIGTGISGNLAARLLAQENDIVVFESSPVIGGHTRTLDVNVFGRTWQVDTGFMVYNDRTYGQFCRMLELLDLSGIETDMSFSVTCASTGLEYQGSSLDGLFAQRLNLVRPKFLGMIRQILRFNRESETMLAEVSGDKSLKDLLSEKGFGGWFAHKYLLPMTAAIWSCPPDEVWDFPAHFLLAFMKNHGLLQISNRPRWKTVAGSARTYVERLTAPIRDRIRTGCPVAGIRREAGKVFIQPKDSGAEVFDRVVLACHADEALKLLQDADPEETAILQALPYHRNTAVLHTDTSILPRRRRAWASWNYHLFSDADQSVAVTYDLSRLQKLDTPSPILLTLNAEEQIDPAKVLDRHVFHHPAYTKGSLRAQELLKERNGRRGTFFCGAYLGYGFHEDGVMSALDVTKHFGLGLDQWKVAFTKAPFTTNA